MSTMEANTNSPNLFDMDDRDFDHWLDTEGPFLIENKMDDKNQKQANSKENIENTLPETQISIKMEFTCSPERICEPNLDYSSDNIVEICLTDSEDENTEGIDSLVKQKSNTNNGDDDVVQISSSIEEEDENSNLGNIMSDHNYTLQEQTKEISNVDLNEDTIKDQSEKSLDKSQMNNNEDVSTDEQSCHSRSTIDEEDQKYFKTFLDDYLGKKEPNNKSNRYLKKLKVEPRSDNNITEQELFVQNVMNVVAEEDAAEEEIVMQETHNKELNSQKIIESETPVTISKENIETNLLSVPNVEALPPPPPPASEETESCSIQSNCDNRNSSEKVLPEENANKENKSTAETENGGQQTNNDSSDSECTTRSTQFTLTENCSEPMEYLTIESHFDHLDSAINEVESSCSTLPLLKEFTTLVDEMHKDCLSFATATNNIESRLNDYILEKFKFMRELSRRLNNNFTVESGQQTDPKLSKKRLRKLNRKNKEALLASSNSSRSSSTSSSSDESETFSLIIKKSQEKQHEIDVNENGENCKSESNLDEKSISDENMILNNEQQEKLSQFSTLTSEGIYDDGIELRKYLRSDVFSLPNGKGNEIASGASTPRKHNQSSSNSSSVSYSSSTSAEEDDSAKSKTNKLKKKSKKKSRKNDEVDDNDKEIERLIDLDGLMKRHNNAPSLKQSEVDKSSMKTQNQKNKTDGVLEFLEKDLAKDSLSSDDSLNEDNEEVITERQYLERRNLDVKNQLLDDSSNDTSNEEGSDDDFDAPLSNESDAGNRSPLVDKFLKKYTVGDSDNADNEDDNDNDDIDAAVEEITNKDEALAKVATEESNKSIKISSEDENAVKKTEENAENNNIKNSPENSDCELLNDNFNYRKRTQSKSLEKIISDAEKRKKLQKLDEDLISLSSESDCSDVEAVDVEPAESTKSRAIKAMLRPDQLHRETLKAQKSESERLRRLEKRQTMISKALKEHPDMATEEELILDYNEETKEFIKVDPGLVKNLKLHQRDGVRFMYESCYGGVDGIKKNHGSGCILAHCMGLGKTLQLITLMHTVISYKELNTSKVLVLCPKSTVMNWGDEIVRWLMPLRTKKLKVYTFNDSSDIKEKLNIMREWSESTHQKAGCLLIGYEAFRTLVFYHKYKIRNNLDTKQIEKIRDKIDSYLLQPGADLVVCDEGHIIKNSKSAISMAVAEIKTPKRIVLTGTPIQNNLKEYYSMVNFIKPLFLGTEKEFANLYANPIKNGQHKDSSKKDIKVMKQRSFVLHKKLSKFVQRKEAELLMSFLPKKFEYVLFIPMTEVQNKLYERILESIKCRDDHRGRGLITDYTCLRKIWTHPKVLEDAWKNAKNLQFKRDARKANSDDDQPDDIYDSQTGFMSVKNDWWRSLIVETDLESILPSNKLRTMFEILRMCEETGEKCLIFSAFVAVLNVVEYFFQKLSNGDKETMKELNIIQGVRPIWEANKDYFRLDGKTSKTTRHQMIKRFNHPQNTRARVFLISAKAGGQGINLIGANRVIILDTSWNPSNDQQNIFRIFRLGQTRNCYIYRLLAMGTMEEKVYSRSVTKQAMSFRVMDVQQIDRHYNMSELAELYTLTIPIFSERPTPVFPQDSILANLLRSFPDLVYKYHEHNSLLENKVEQELSEQEKNDAWAAYEQDLQMNSQLSQMPNTDDLQNRMPHGQMPNYASPGTSAYPGFNMQSLVGYRGMTPPTNTSYMNPMMNQYTNFSNQQFLDLVNTFRQFGQPNDSAYNAMIANTYSMLTGRTPPPPGVGTAHSTSGGSISANPGGPINALSELARYGLGSNNGPNAALSATTGSVNSLFASAAMPSTSSAIYPNPAALYYEKYQTAMQQLTAANGGVGIPSLSNLQNSAAFQAPRRTPPQTGMRKSNTPDLTGYRNSGIGNGASTPTSITPMANTTMPSNPNELPRFPNNPNFNTSSNNANVNLNNDLLSPNNRKNDTTTINRTGNKSTAITSSANTTLNVTATRTGTTSLPTSITSTTNTPLTITTKSYSRTTSKVVTTTPTSMATTLISSSTVPTKTTTTTATLKTSDPQIRVRNMDQLYANGSRINSLPTAAKEIPTNNFASNATTTTNTNSTSNTTNSVASRNKQTMDNRLLSSATTTSTATTTAAAADLLKARSEMQIIPTTSPPGTASISKQLSEISPSISLTAVHQNTAQKSNNSNNIHSGISKSSIVSASTANTRNISSNRINHLTNVTTTTPANRQQIVSSSIQQRKSATGTNNSMNSNKATAYTRKITNVPSTSTTVGTSSSSTMGASSMHLNTKKSMPNSNNTKVGQNIVTTTVTPTMPSAVTPTTKSVPSILRQQYIRKPSPVPSLKSSNINPNTLTSQSPNVATSGNTKPAYIISSKTTNSMPTSNNVAQYLYNKNGTAQNRSYSPTTSIATTATAAVGSVPISVSTSRTGTPANATTTTTAMISKRLPINNGVVSKSKSTGMLVTLPTTPSTSTTPSTTTTTMGKNSAFPVQLQRSNTTVQVVRSKAPIVGMGNRTQSSASIVTPKIASVSSLNTTPMTTAMGNSSANPIVTAARVAAIKKTAGKVNTNLQIGKQTQIKRFGAQTSTTATMASTSAMKTAAATAVAQQKRSNTAIGIMRPQQQQQQQPQQLMQQQTSIQRVIAPTTNNGGVGVSSLNTSRISAGGTQIGGINVRPIPKGTLSSPGMVKLLKRKGSEIISSNSSKRPKDS